MGKIAVAVCDTDNGYRERFVTYLVEHKSKEYAVYAFSAVEHFLDVLKKQIFDVVIFGEGFADAKNPVCEQQIPSVMLKDTVPERLAEDMGYRTEGICRSVSVFRYQPMAAILHEVQVLVGGSRPENEAVERRALRLEVIGVYSPIGHEMQMPFALVFAEMLAEKRKVLYVNFMRHSGFLQLFGLPGQYDVGDIALRLRNKRLHAETFLKCVYESNRVYYIPPFHNPENLDDFSFGDYLALLGFLEDSTDFEAVVFDFGDGIHQFSEVLKTCTSVYCPVKTGFFYECRLNRFLEYLEKSAAKEVCEQLHIINLPFSAKQIRGGGDVRKQLLWSEFGDYVRSCFFGGSV